MAAAILGLVFFQPFSSNSLQNSAHWLPYGVLLGIMFIAMFYLIGTSAQKAGITVTTLANKLSLVFPVLFSLIFFNEQISTIKYIGLATATLAVVLTVYKKDVNKTKLLYIVLPIVIFLGSGMVDSLVKFVQALKISESEVSLYTISVFFVSFICGVIISVINKEKRIKFQSSTLILGIMLGGANFGSLYFLISALNKSGLNSSLVFAINNMSIVAFTSLLGTLLFKENLNKFNFAGIALAIVSLYFLL